MGIVIFHVAVLLLCCNKMGYYPEHAITVHVSISQPKSSDAVTVDYSTERPSFCHEQIQSDLNFMHLHFMFIMGVC